MHPVLYGTIIPSTIIGPPRRTAMRKTAPLALCAALMLFAPLARYATAHAQGTELDETLFVQAPEHDNGGGGIVLIWIPEPLQRVCLGKTYSQCAAMDYCIRTTVKNVPMCRNLAVPLSRLPAYPPGMRPRRMMSLNFYKITPNGPYAALQNYYNSLPPSVLTRISTDARIKARIRFTAGSNDDSIQLEQVLATAPF